MERGEDAKARRGGQAVLGSLDMLRESSPVRAQQVASCDHPYQFPCLMPRENWEAADFVVDPVVIHAKPDSSSFSTSVR